MPFKYTEQCSYWDVAWVLELRELYLQEVICLFVYYFFFFLFNIPIFPYEVSLDMSSPIGHSILFKWVHLTTWKVN